MDPDWTVRRPGSDPTGLSGAARAASPPSPSSARWSLEFPGVLARLRGDSAVHPLARAYTGAEAIRMGVLTASGRRIVWAASLLALAIDLWIRVLPLIPPVPEMTGRRIFMSVVLVGIPLVQVALVEGAGRMRYLKGLLIGISAAWFVAAVLFTFEGALLYVPSGGLWIAGALDTPKPRR